MKQYLVVPGPKSISVEKGQANEAFTDFQNLINQQARTGWTYHSMETLTVSEKQGCNKGVISVNYYMLIFERDA